MQSSHPLQAAKAEKLKALHQREGIFVIPNPWDAGSAKILESFGFEALTTTSAGLAYMLAKPDGTGACKPERNIKKRT